MASTLAAASGELGRTICSTGTASVTFTLASTRRVRIDVWGALLPAYNTGASVVRGSAVRLSMSEPIPNSVLLTAGTYTAYGLVNRAGGGSATIVTDLGAPTSSEVDLDRK